MVLYIAPVPNVETVHATFDGYDARGAHIGSFNTWSLNAMTFGG